MIVRLLYRELRARPWQTLASMIGIAMGVAVVVAVQVANDSVERGFQLSNEALSGRATHELTGGPRGFDEQIYLTLRRNGGLTRAAPMVNATAKTVEDERLQIVGIDPFVDSELRAGVDAAVQLDAALFASELPVLMHPTRAQAMGLALADRFQIRVHGQLRSVTLVGHLPNNVAMRSWLLTDISVAQDLAGRRGLLDRVDVILDSPQQLKALQQMLPPGVNLASSQSRSKVQKEMTRALETNLTALSLLALVIGMFLVYNATSFSVLRRRRQIGLVRALGVTAREVFVMVLAEAVLLGVLASIVGVVTGLVLADVLLEFLTRTINDLYFRVEVTRLEFNLPLLAAIVVLGTVASVLAAMAPAFEATFTEPRAAMLRSDLERNALKLSHRIGWLGLAVVALGVFVVVVGGQGLVPAFAGLFLIIAGSALLVPAAVSPLTRLFAKPARLVAGHSGVMAVRNIDRGRSRTGVALAALVVAVSATSGVGLMIGNFRTSVSDWLAGYLTADVYVAATEELGRELPPQFIERAGAIDGVEAIDLGRWTRLRMAQEQTLMFALDTTEPRFTRYRLIQGDSENLFARFQRGEVLVTEALAYKRKIKPGQQLTLPTEQGPLQFTVAGVYRDYGSDSGVVLMDGDIYRTYWNDQTRTSMALYLEPGVDDVAVSEKLQTFTELPDAISVFSNKSLQQESLNVFDRTFAVTRVLRLLAIIIAVVGIVSALTAIQTERLRQSALLRAIGMTQGQITSMSLLEAAVMGLIAGILALPLGVVTAWILASVVNRRAFGWSMDFHFDISVLLEGVVIAVVAALIAGALAALSLNARHTASGLRNE